jgi:hypothetical protein
MRSAARDVYIRARATVFWTSASLSNMHLCGVRRNHRQMPQDQADLTITSILISSWNRGDVTLACRHAIQRRDAAAEINRE